VASVSSGFAIRRPNGAGSLRRSDSIRNNCRTDPRSLNYRGATRGIMAASAAGFRARARPPGTDFLDAETGRQKSPPKWVSAHRDTNPGNQWSENPVETASLASCWKRTVCKDWMVVCAVRYEPVSGGQFPANREINREFRDSGPSEANFVARNHCAAATFYEIPYAN
jgi:hypothetical protein